MSIKRPLVLFGVVCENTAQVKAITAASPANGKPTLAAYACRVSVQRSPLTTFIVMLGVGTLIRLLYIKMQRGLTADIEH
jgi:hypothetical protein